jgi:hypothetical protein
LDRSIADSSTSSAGSKGAGRRPTASFNFIFSAANRNTAEPFMSAMT